jgi:D-arabinose 1-dehydrogenase-like Zn-dependent alcohol dehydrogenase
MRAIRQVAFGGIDVLEDAQVDSLSPAPGEVVVDVVATGACFLDIAVRSHERQRMSIPRTIGHEAAGVIAAVGDGVAQDRVGEAVIVRPIVPCYSCRYCFGDRSGVCPDGEMLGEAREGVFAEQVAVPSSMVLPLPPGVSFAAGAIAGCALSSAEAGVDVARIRLGDTVFVRGASGGIGIHAALLARIAGAGLVIGSTRQASKADFLRAHGIEPLITEPGAEKEAMSTLKALTDGGPDVIIDVAGGWGEVDYSRWAGRGARLVFVGDLFGKPVPINPSALIYRGVSVLTAQGTTYSSIERSLRVLQSGRLTPVLMTFEGFDGLLEAHRRVEEGSVTGRAVTVLKPDLEAERRPEALSVRRAA